MRKFPNTTIRQKLSATVMLTVVTALLIASLAFMTYETFTYRSIQRRELGVMADLVEANSAAALTFEDAAQAQAALKPLEGQGDVQSASLFNLEGAQLAGFRKHPGEFLIDAPRFLAQDRIWFAEGRLQMARAINFQGRKIGTLCLIADLGGLRQEFLWSGMTVLVISGLSYFMAYGVSLRLQRGLAGPLAQLASAARSVAKNHDYGIRVLSSGQGELGLLMDDFNGMLAQIHQRDRELKDHQDRLEDLVQTRTRQLEADMAERKTLEKQFLQVQRLESLGTLAGGVAHDLNNVLAPILLSIQYLQERVTDPRDQKVLAVIESSSLRGRDIVRQILGFARGIEGERAPVDLEGVLKELTSIIRQTFPKNITIRSGLSPKLDTVIGDATQIHQLLLNLCVNARDAMGKGGQLSLGVHNSDVTESQAKLRLGVQPGAYVVLSVADTGCGMGPQTLDRMFEPFFSTKETGKGTGLGLSTVHTIARSHGGFVRCSSEIGRGTTFQVFLPATGSAPKPVAGHGEARGNLAPARVQGSGELVLVVDDEAFIREMTRHTLEAFGFQAISACDGREAVALYAARPGEIALVLTDMMMPVMDGLKTIQALRKLDPAVKIIATSGFQGNDPPGAMDAGGADAFLAKPFSAEKLLRAIHQVLGQGRT